VQKRLRALLPRDYAKDYKKFHPSSDANMRLRFSRMRRCKEGRVCKKPYSISSNRNETTSSINNHIYEKTTGLMCNYSSPSGQAQSVPSSPTHYDSQTIDPSLLLFNNSTDQPRYGAAEFGAETVTRRKPSISPNLPNVETPGLSKITADHKRSSSTSASICSLRKRFANTYSTSYLEHIASVLRYSSSNSWRSSLISMTSLASSRFQLVNQDETTMKDIPRSKNTAQDKSIGLQNSATQLPKCEQDIWDELVDESQLMSTLQTFYNSFMLTRPCCSSIFGPGNTNKNPILQPDGLLCIECEFSV
jgi:hypothetical protein